MGVSVRNGARDLLVRAMLELDRPAPRLRVAELGDQMLKRELAGHRTKSLWEFLGAEHVSFDRTARRGSEPCNLSLLLRDQGHAPLMGTFDLVTNFGTTEHVRGQLAAFQNVHELCRVGGVMAHLVPAVGTPHGKWRYSRRWFERLAERQGYRVRHLSARRGYVRALLRRLSPSGFEAANWEQPEKGR